MLLASFFKNIIFSVNSCKKNMVSYPSGIIIPWLYIIKRNNFVLLVMKCISTSFSHFHEQNEILGKDKNF